MAKKSKSNYKRATLRDVDLLTKEQMEFVWEQDVNSQELYNYHKDIVAKKLGIDKEIVSGVLDSYFRNIMKEINKYRKNKTIINVYGFIKLTILKGKNLYQNI